MWRKDNRERDGVHTPRIAVIGGGMAGLAAAHRLLELAAERRKAVEVRLFETAARTGGSIATERTDGFVIEAGPDSFLSEKPWALQLCERLGLTQRLVGTREEFRRTYVAFRGKLHPLPEGFFLLAPTRLWPLAFSGLFSWRAKMRMGLDLVLPRRSGERDESLGSFVRRRFGREVLERVAQPLVGGIYTADPETLSIEATMPRFLEMERQHRSIILAMRRGLRRTATSGSGARWSLFVSLDDGMQTLTDELTRRLPEGALHVRTPIHALQLDVKGGWVLNGNLYCDAVILATPAHVSARLLSNVDSSLAEELRQIPYASSATVTLAYRREQIPHPLDGFGFVVPAIEKRAIVACTLSSLKYPRRAPLEYVLLRCFVGGALQPQMFAQDDETMEGSVRRELQDLLGIEGQPLLRRIHRHPDAMPQYPVGHVARVERLEARASALPHLALAGSAYRGVGLPDCIHSGETAAAAVLGGRPARAAG